MLSGWITKHYPTGSDICRIVHLQYLAGSDIYRILKFNRISGRTEARTGYPVHLYSRVMVRCSLGCCHVEHGGPRPPICIGCALGCSAYAATSKRQRHGRIAGVRRSNELKHWALIADVSPSMRADKSAHCSHSPVMIALTQGSQLFWNSWNSNVVQKFWSVKMSWNLPLLLYRAWQFY